MRKHGMTVIGDEAHREIYLRLFGEQFDIKFVSLDEVLPKEHKKENSLEAFFEN